MYVYDVVSIYFPVRVCICTPQKWAVTEGISPGMGEKVALWPSLTPGRAGSLLPLLLLASDVPLVVLPPVPQGQVE